MTGERPEDEDVLEPTADEGADDAAEPMREPRASERFSGPTQKTVVSQERASAAVAAESARTTVDEKGRPVPDDGPHYVDDRASKVWVGVIVAIFLGILLWGLLGGKGGFFSPQPTPEPSPTPVPSLTLTPRPSTTPRPTTSPAPTTSGSPAASPTAAPSASPTSAPTAAPSPT